MTGREVRVIKLGGSLLNWPAWPTQFRRWLSLQTPAADVLVVGGGGIVDWVRELDRAEVLVPEAAHWLAVRAMGLTATVVAAELTEATLVHTLDGLQLASASAPQILDVEEMLRKEQGLPDALPCNWDVTSDSIAARVAVLLGAQELVLLKSALPESALPESSAGSEAWAAEGFVDVYFPRAARGLRIRCVDLRDRDFRQVVAL